jgi:hypothetical protein
VAARLKKMTEKDPAGLIFFIGRARRQNSILIRREIPHQNQKITMHVKKGSTFIQNCPTPITQWR